MTKSYRQGQILKLIQGSNISTQEDLALALKDCGIETTQVTLSRDIREMGLLKTPDGYQALSAGKRPGDLPSLIGEFLRDVRSAQNQLVLRTAPGHASSVAVALDSAEWPEIVGTLAGDDTVLIICPDSEIAGQVRERLLDMLG